eukprot:m.423369 g.423369  ORF g.423369 m.423369 type:complete len:769 (+) comp16855_c0_seq4:96-2402(+)
MAKKKGRLPAGKAGRRLALKKRAEEESAEIARLTALLAPKDEAADAGAGAAAEPTYNRFADFPISRRTLSGLEGAGFTTPTPIQRQALLSGLRGEDVLGAAKTGSGKTLAFLIPVIERLWRLRWSKMDGVGAVVISPTRELALQTFQALASVGGKHDMSAGLIIGGTTFEREQANIPFTNILICTPGRLLQHLDETPNFDCMQLQVLVLDEADRILDLGFAKAMDAIVRGMPKTRQTLLFSATQTSGVAELARLSLKSPTRVNTNPPSESATPDSLVQAYTVCPLDRKLDVLFSFIKSHLDSKTLVFVSSCKQVRYIYETFRRFRPGVPLMALYGKQKQMKRVAIFTDFTKKSAAVLFATDIAARGLDFPAIDWVFQLDCPESVETYIHRVGRTARFDKGGKALMTLLPSEVGFVPKLEARKITLHKTEIAEDQMKSVAPLLRSLCASDPDLKYLAQKSFISYFRSVHLQSDKEVFLLDQLPADDFAASIGLPSTPRIKFSGKKVKKIQERALPDLAEYEGLGAAPETGSTAERPAKVKKSKFEALRTRQNQDVLSAHRLAVREDPGLDESEGDRSTGDGLLVKSSVQRHEAIEAVAAEEDPEARSKKKKRQVKTRADVLRQTAGPGKHLTFGEDGTIRDERERLVGWEAGPTAMDEAEIPVEVGVHDLTEASRELEEADVIDRQVERERLRERRRRKKLRLREERMGVEAEGAVAVLGGGGSDGEESGGGGWSGDEGAAEGRGKRSKVDQVAMEDEELALWLLQNSK